MTNERKKVLEMLAAGQISAEDAARLLAKLEEGDDILVPASSDKRPLKYLRVLVNIEGGDKINVRVPLGLLRTGIKLSTMVPSKAGEHLKEQGVDLSHLSSLSGDELIEELRELKVDVNSTDGDTIRVFCE